MIFALALMTIARRGADSAEHGGAVFVENAADGLLLADFAHFALALDRGVCHQRFDPEFTQGFGHFLHFSGAPLAMDRHPFQL